jgi:flagellar hook-associated protein FlgK
MSGIAMVMNTAKGALAAQQLGLNVVGNNIANVNSPGYSRQSAPQTPTLPVSIAGFLLGTGVAVETIQQAADQLLENRLIDAKSSLAGFEEASRFMNVLEGLFTENTENSFGTQMAAFWNTWQDLSNNPAGAAEREAVYEKGCQVADLFNTLSAQLAQMAADLAAKMAPAVDRINAISANIAALNNQIIGLEVNQVANSLRDERNALLTELSQLIDTRSFEQPDGSLTVTVAKGFPLVSGADSYPLELQQGQVHWLNSSGAAVDISDKIGGGQLHGWLEIQDEVLPKYQTELDGLADAFAWAVNQVHSQGVGLEYFSGTVTGAYATDPSGLLTTLPMGGRIDTSKDFKMWIQDNRTSPPGYDAVVIDLDAQPPSASPLTVAPSGAANSVLDTYTFKVSPPGAVIGADPVEITWASSAAEETSALGPGALPLSIAVDGMDVSFTAATGALDEFTISTDAQGVPTASLPSDSDYWTLNDFAAAFNTAVGAPLVAASVVDNRLVFSAQSGDYRFAFGDDGFDDSGLAAALGFNTFFAGQGAAGISVNGLLADKALIAAARIEAASGEISAGDNRNALALADVQHDTYGIAQWTFARGRAATSTAFTSTLEGFHGRMVGSMGLQALRFYQSQESAGLMVNSLQQQRDSVSAVSLDEEMINLIKYQQAYTAASKLLSVSDEMLIALINSR